MAEGIYTLTLSDGTQIGGLKVNGNNFVSKQEISEGTFKGKLGRVEVSGEPGDGEDVLLGEHGAMELVQVAHYTREEHGVEDGYYFILRDIPADELEKRQLRADVDFAIMLGGASF